jgi:PAS domain S-box-containing protein
MENDLSRVIDALPGLVWTALPDGHIDFLNQRWSEYAGLSMEEASGRGWLTAIHPEDLPEVLERWPPILASDAPHEMKARLRRFDGEYRWFLFRTCPMAGSSGQVIKWCGMISPVEERSEGEEPMPVHARTASLKRANEQLEAEVAERKRSEERLTTQHAIARTLAESVTLTEAAPKLLRAIGDGMGWAWGALWTVDSEADVMRCTNTWHAPSLDAREFDAVSREATFARGQGIVGQAWLRGEPAWLVDAGSDGRFLRAPAAARAGLHGAITFPILLGHDVQGVIEFLDRTVREPDTEQLAVLAAIGSQVGQFIERLRVEEAVRDGEALKAAILDSALDCIVTIDHLGCITEFNPAAERTFGYRRGEVVGKHLADVIIPPSLRDDHRRGFARYLATGEARLVGRRLEITAVRADGSEFPVELAITRIPLEGPPCFTGYLRDITERKQSEEELRRSEALLAEVQHLSSTCSFWWCVATDAITWSKQAYRIFELDEGLPVTFELIFSRIHPEDLPLVHEMLDRARGDGRDFAFEHRLQRPDGSVKRLHVFAHATRDQDGQLEFIGSVQDVTERRRAEEALSGVRSELAHVTRVMSLGTLTASIAHEVNQPLSGIITNASTCLRMLGADPPNVDGALETARRTIRDGNRAADVIARLRALFGNEGVAIEAVDLNEATREVIALSSSELRRSRVILRTELADDLPLVAGDRVQLQQVILNLLLNASEAMSGVDDRPRHLVIGTQRDDDDQVCLAVQDAGVGFGTGGADELFHAFYTTKSGGMGIGLSVSRSIIESHNGRLWAVNNSGPGATFSFSIPCAPDMRDR